MSDTPDTKTPDEIRLEIDQTREELGDTVEALGAKADVKGQARAKVDEIKGNVNEIKGNVQAKVSGLGSKAQGAAPEGATSGGQQLAAKVRENPAPVALGGALLLGFLVGRRRGAR